jgi:hypothetical protein
MQDGATPSTKTRLEHACQHLGPRALQLLADIAERLAKGAKQYGGDFDDKPRDWVQETLEETADGLVYASMKLLEVREAKAADEARNRAARRLSDEVQQLANQAAGQQAYTVSGITQAMRREPSPVAAGGIASVRALDPDYAPSPDYGQNREPLGPDFYKHYGPPTERDGVWAECKSKPATWPLTTPGEDWEKTRAGCG